MVQWFQRAGFGSRILPSALRAGRCAATAKPQCTWMCRCREAQDVRERPPGELVNLYYGSNPPQFPMDKKMAPLLGARGAIFLSIGNW